MLCSGCTLFKSALFLKYTPEKPFAIFFLRQVTSPFLQEAVVGCAGGCSRLCLFSCSTSLSTNEVWRHLGKSCICSKHQQFVVIPQRILRQGKSWVQRVSSGEILDIEGRSPAHSDYTEKKTFWWRTLNPCPVLCLVSPCQGSQVQPVLHSWGFQSLWGNFLP